jgi:hypothetical protein
MKRTRKTIVILLLACIVPALILGCGSTYAAKAPPPPIHEIRSAKPFHGAVWIGGHWDWNSRSDSYVWVQGHWTNPRPGKVWVAGHWERAPRGHVWVKGHWR